MNTLSDQPYLAAARPVAREYRRYLLLALIGLLYFCPFMRLAPRTPDEGTLLTGAVRVAEGQVPARDFFEGMGPGTFCWLALFFKIFGTNWFASRIWLVLNSLATAGMMCFLARRLRSKFELTPAILMAGASFGLLWPAISHHGDSNFFALLSFAVFVYWWETRRPFFLPVIGALAGITTCFLQQKGILLLVSFIVVVAYSCRGQRLRHVGWLCAGYFAVGTVVVAVFWRAGALGDAIYAFAIWPLTRYGGANSVPYGIGVFGNYWHQWTESLNGPFLPVISYCISAVLMLPFLLVVALPALLAAFALKWRKLALEVSTVPYWICGLALWLSEMQRKDIWHLVYGSPILVVLCLYLYGRLTDKWTRAAMRLLAASACVLAIFNFLVVSMARVPIATRRGLVYDYQPDPTLKYLESQIKPGEEILAYPCLPIYYFVLDARNATRYSFLTRGMHTEAQFREVVDALERKKVKHVILGMAYDDPRIAWAFPHRPKGRPIVESYLLEHYRIVYTDPGIRLLERKN